MNFLMILLCIVTYVYDGDTIKCIDDKNQIYKIRLLGIDSPEFTRGECKSQPYSKIAKNYLNDLIKDQEVIIYITGKDKYDRNLGFIYKDEVDINSEMIKAGLAERYRGKKDYKEHPYFIYEYNARKEYKGMWQQLLWNNHQYESPREFRERCLYN